MSQPGCRYFLLLRRGALFDPYALHSVAKLLAVDLVTVAQEIGGRGVVREGVHDLLGGPVGSGVFGHVEVDDAPAMVGEHDEDEEDAEPSGGHGEEVDRTRRVADAGQGSRSRAGGGRRRTTGADGAGGAGE